MFLVDFPPISTIKTRNDGDVFVEIGGNRLKSKKISLIDIVSQEKTARFNSPIVLVVEEQRVNIGQIIYSEMFIKPSMIKSTINSILWDSGINFIGDKSIGLFLQLYLDEEEKYSFVLPFQ